MLTSSEIELLRQDLKLALTHSTTPRGRKLWVAFGREARKYSGNRAASLSFLDVVTDISEQQKAVIAAATEDYLRQLSSLNLPKGPMNSSKAYVGSAGRLEQYGTQKAFSQLVNTPRGTPA